MDPSLAGDASGSATLRPQLPVAQLPDPSGRVDKSSVDELAGACRLQRRRSPRRPRLARPAIPAVEAGTGQLGRVIRTARRDVARPMTAPVTAPMTTSPG